MGILRGGLQSPQVGPWHHSWVTDVFCLVHKVKKDFLMSYDRRHYLQILIPSFYWKNQKIWQHISYILAWHHGAEAKEGRVYYP